MSTYLSLVTDLLMETALSGGGPPSGLDGITGDQAKAAYWTKQADLQIQREWLNRDFLWARASGLVLTSGSEFVPGVLEADVSIINLIKRKSLAIIQSDLTAHFPVFKDWNNSDFSELWTYETQAVSDLPAYWSLRPDRKIVLSSPIETTGRKATYDYFRKPKALSVDLDVSLIPDDFTRLVVAGAKIMYAEHEDAPEVSAGAHEEYDFLLSEMEAAHLPDQGFNRESHSDADLVVVSE